MRVLLFEHRPRVVMREKQRKCWKCVCATYAIAAVPRIVCCAVLFVCLAFGSSYACELSLPPAHRTARLAPKELRRGMDRAEVSSICFNQQSTFVACCSDRGTVHIFSLEPGTSNGPGAGGGGGTGTGGTAVGGWEEGGG